MPNILYIVHEALPYKEIVVFIVYVDDMVLAKNDEEEIFKLKRILVS